MSEGMDPGVMGIGHLLSQSSGMGLVPLVLLVLMSLGSGYYLLFKSWSGWQEKRLGRRFLSRFWQCQQLQGGVAAVAGGAEGGLWSAGQRRFRGASPAGATLVRSWPPVVGLG